VWLTFTQPLNFLRGFVHGGHRSIQGHPMAVYLSRILRTLPRIRVVERVHPGKAQCTRSPNMVELIFVKSPVVRLPSSKAASTSCMTESVAALPERTMLALGPDQR